MRSEPWPHDQAPPARTASGAVASTAPRVAGKTFGALMVLAVALVAALSTWDDARESAAALDDFAREQASLAQVTAAGLAAQLDARRGDGRTTAIDPWVEGAVATRARPEANRGLPGSAALERPDERLVLLRSPRSPRFRTTDGRDVAVPAIATALDAGRTSLRLSRAEAASLGLPPRTAMAGLASIDAGPQGRWSLAVVTSAGRERDRELRARWRVVLGVLLAAALVGAFGSAALATERRQHGLARRLAASERERERESALVREGRAATMVTLAAGIAHEISTPLGVIAGRAEQLAERLPPGDERSARCTGAILEQTQRIREVIEGLLHLARGGELVLEPIDLGAVLAATADLVSHRFDAAGVALVVDAHPDRDAAPGVRGDPRLLEHAVVNLALNACDACVRGGRVEVAMIAERGRVVLTVDDDGAGIDPAHAARIGEPFFSTKAHGRGTGLGLAIATEIVRLHHGTLALAPRRPRGTRATITLPTSEEDGSHGP